MISKTFRAYPNVRTQGEGQTVEIHDRLEDERISRYTNTRGVPLACGVHANLCSCGRIAGRSWLVVPAIFSAASLSLCLFNRGVCVCAARVRKIRNITAMENYIPQILDLNRSTALDTKMRRRSCRSLPRRVRSPFRRVRRPFERNFRHRMREREREIALNALESLSHCSSSPLYNS